MEGLNTSLRYNDEIGLLSDIHVRRSGRHLELSSFGTDNYRK